jgi:hypothetical protein
VLGTFKEMYTRLGARVNCSRLVQIGAVEFREE